MDKVKQVSVSPVQGQYWTLTFDADTKLFNFPLKIEKQLGFLRINVGISYDVENFSFCLICKFITYSANKQQEA